MGYHLAGFEVVGVDIAHQPRYPFQFVQGDALEYLATHGHEFDAIHASPPCQAYSHLTPEANKCNHKKLIPAVRELCRKIGKPYCIENVAGARKELEAPAKCDHSEIPLLVTTASKASRELRFKLGMKPKSVENAPLAYGIDWLTFSELKEAIPPAYTQFIGMRMKEHLAT